MTYLEKLKKEHPEAINDYCYSQCEGCPSEYGYISEEEEACHPYGCKDCWNQKIPNLNKFKLENKIIVVGNFHEYNTQYTITNLIKPEMKLNIAETSFTEEIENAMKGKVATTILNNMLHNQLAEINSLPILEILYDKLEKEIKNNLVKIKKENTELKIERFLYNKLEKNNEDIYLLLTNVFTKQEIKLLDRTINMTTTFKVNGILKEYAKIDCLLDPLLKESVPIIYKQWEDCIQKEIDKIKKIMEEDNQIKINYLYEEENTKIEIRDITSII